MIISLPTPSLLDFKEAFFPKESIEVIGKDRVYKGECWKFKLNDRD